MKTRTNFIVLFFAFAALAFSGCGEKPHGDPVGPSPTAAKPDPVTFTTPDAAHVIISANFYKADVENAPAVILIHQRGSNKEAWGPFIDKILARGYNVLAFDVRGHGGSTKKTDGSVVGQPEQGQWWECKKDAQAAIDFLLTKGINKDKIAVIGASVGASVATYAASENARIKGVIMLSPVMSIDPAVAQAAASLGDRKVFIYYSKGDTRGGNEESAKQFAAQMTESPPVMHAFDGSDHGMAMLGKKYGDTDVDESILKELDSILK